MAKYDEAYWAVVNNKPRYVEILQAAQEGDPSALGEMTPSEKEVYDGLVEELDWVRKMNGGTLDGIDIDLSYESE